MFDDFLFNFYAPAHQAEWPLKTRERWDAESRESETKTNRFRAHDSAACGSIAREV